MTQVTTDAGKSCEVERKRWWGIRWQEWYGVSGELLGLHRHVFHCGEDSLPALKGEERFQHGQGSVRTPWTTQYLLSLLTVVGGGHTLWDRPCSKPAAPVYFLCHDLAQKRESELCCVLWGTSMFLEQGSFYLVAQHWEHCSFGKKGNEERSTFHYSLSYLLSVSI